jgi:anti-sigma-K factor RskA
MPKGAVFAVTVERAGGVPAPTQAPEFTAKMS